MNHTPRSGFTILELLLAITITAILIAAIMTAMSGTLNSYRINSDTAEFNHSVRTMLERLTREVRTSTDATSATNTLTITPKDTTQADQVQYILSNGDFIYRATKSGSTTDYTLLGNDENITVDSFVPTIVRRTDDDGVNRAILVKIAISYTMDGETFPLVVSASPRRNYR
jgi:prepilin-type N-terminal cleavage/methylation domain-containing protein